MTEIVPSESKGIVICVSGHPYYGRMAWNLLQSIKAVEKSCKVAICYNGNVLSHLDEFQIDDFDFVIEMDPSVPAQTICKLYSSVYSPFDNTLLLDADTLWLPVKKPSDLFNELSSVDFTGITEGKEGDAHPHYFFWADPGEIREHYEIQSPIHQYRTEFLYFNREGRKVVSRALQIVLTHKLKTVVNFAHNVPDELGINIAASEMGIEPHRYKWRPSYWPLMHGNHIPMIKTIADQYYIMSFGANKTNGVMKSVYNTIMSHACMVTQRKHVFPLYAKIEYNKDRNLM